MLGVPKEAEHCRAWRIPATKPRRDIDLLLARQPSKYRRVIVGVALVRVGRPKLIECPAHQVGRRKKAGCAFGESVELGSAIARCARAVEIGREGHFGEHSPETSIWIAGSFDFDVRVPDRLAFLKPRSDEFAAPWFQPDPAVQKQHAFFGRRLESCASCSQTTQIWLLYYSQ